MALLPRRATVDTTPPRVHVRLLTVEICPCDAVYTCSFNRQPDIWAAWVRVHALHGFEERND